MNTTTPKTTRCTIHTLAAALLFLTITLLASVNAAQAKPIKEIVTAHVGWETDKTTGKNLCTVESKHECQPGKETINTGGFSYIRDIAVDNDPSSPYYGDVYAADAPNGRIQVFAHTGQFVMVIGWDVNKTKVQKGGATQQEMNVCTQGEIETGTECQTGTKGVSPEHFNEILGLAVDPATGNIYLAEEVHTPDFKQFGDRIQEITPEDRFVMEAGQEVNETTKGNICAATEQAKGIKCAGPSEHPNEEAELPTTEPDEFSLTKPGSGAGQPLIIGGLEDTVYVGEKGRVQELKATGQFKSEIRLARTEVQSLAVDSSGDIYLTPLLPHKSRDGSVTLFFSNVIERFGAQGNETGRFEISARRSEDVNKEAPENVLLSLAVDPAGRLAVVEAEGVSIPQPPYTAYYHRGALYNVQATRLMLVSEFSDLVPVVFSELEAGIRDIAFSTDGSLYSSYSAGDIRGNRELIVYAPVAVGELVTGGVVCTAGKDSGSDATLDCGLNGEADPWGVQQTEAWFQWGSTASLGSETPKQNVGSGEAMVKLAPAGLTGLMPNGSISYRLAGTDENVEPPEQLAGEMVTSKLPSVPPRIVDRASAQFVRPNSADLFGTVNPENAPSEYFFEYAAGEQPLAERCPKGLVRETCPGVRRTGTNSSSSYGTIGASFEASGLQPATVYRYRLAAVNQAGETAVNEKGVAGALPEGSFTTLAAPVPEAQTGGASAIAANSATVSGSVNPHGQPAIYMFELGVYDPAGTQYGTVLSAPAGNGTGPAEETTTLTGLQPGTTYAYRITASSSLGTSYGTPVLFTTQGLPALIPVPVAMQLLDVPQIAFPTGYKPSVRGLTKCRRGYVHDRHGRCVKPKNANRHTHGKKKRMAKARKSTRVTSLPHAGNGKGAPRKS